MTPLLGAMQEGHVDLVQLLLEHGADADAEMVTGSRPTINPCRHLNRATVVCAQSPPNSSIVGVAVP
jgi:ankyrin repeat protein